jgi:serine/threonine protein kinase
MSSELRVLRPLDGNTLDMSGSKSAQPGARWVVDEIRRAVRDFKSDRLVNQRVLEYSGEFDIATKSDVFTGLVPRIGGWSKGVCIGSGSAGCIYQGNSGDFVFAAKQIPLENAPLRFSYLTESLKTEIEALSFANGHPHIVGFHGAELLHASLFIYMGFSPGYVPLSQRVKLNGPLSELELIDLAAQILEALTYLHSHRVIHRDIKASNVLVDAGVYRLCDFGSAAVFQPSGLIREIGDTAVDVEDAELLLGDWLIDDHFWAEGVKGTCNWMAPEVMQGCVYGSNVDCWSLGCTLIEAGTAKIPWREFDNQLAATFVILQSEKNAFDFVEKRITIRWSSLLRNFLKSCLIRDPTIRWSSHRLQTHPWIYLPALN